MAHIICDSCDATLQVGAASLGKKIRCPKCKATFTARENEVIDDFDEVEEDEDERPVRKKAKTNRASMAEDDDEDQDRPRKKQGSKRRTDDDDDDDRRPAKKRPKKKQKGGKGLVIGLTIGGVVLLIGAAVVVVVLVLPGNANNSSNPGGSGKPSGGISLSIFSEETWAKMKKGMSRQEAEAILGPGAPRQLKERDDDIAMDFMHLENRRYDAWQATIAKGGVMLVWVSGKYNAIQLLVNKQGKVLDGNISMPMKDTPGGVYYTQIGYSLSGHKR